ncbi:MAG: hypothetical protein NTW26_06980 [bacterium]|nr:hypothetical protein [bacterium]
MSDMDVFALAPFAYRRETKNTWDDLVVYLSSQTASNEELLFELIRNFKNYEIFKRVECIKEDDNVIVEYYPRDNIEEQIINDEVGNLFVEIVRLGYRPIIGLGYEGM